MPRSSPVLLALLAGAGCGPDWDGVVEVYALDGAAAPAPPVRREKNAGGAAGAGETGPCQLVADERCVRDFDSCDGRLGVRADFDTEFDCSEARRVDECWRDREQAVGRAYDSAGARDCVEALVARPGCAKEVIDVFAQCAAQLWSPVECDRRVDATAIAPRAPLALTLGLQAEGRLFMPYGPFVSVCLELDPAQTPTLTLRTLPPAAAEPEAPTLDTVVFLYDPDGAYVGSNDDPAEADPAEGAPLLYARLDRATVSRPGAHNVVVAGFRPDHAGAVRLQVSAPAE